jgi:hypothetical protein
MAETHLICIIIKMAVLSLKNQVRQVDGEKNYFSDTQMTLADTFITRKTVAK